MTDQYYDRPHIYPKNFPADEIEAREILDDINDLVQSVAPDGKFLYTNRAWRETLGYTAEEVGRLNIFDIIHPASREHCATLFGRILNGEKLGSIETFFITKNGAAVAVDGSSICIFKNETPVATRSVFRNITDRKRSEQALRESEERFQAFMKNIPAMAFMKDEQGRYVYVNEMMQRLFSIPDYKTENITAADLVTDEYVAKPSEYFRKVMETGKPLETIDSAPTPDGVMRHWATIRFPFTKANGQRLVGGVAFDITNRVEAEERLRNSERHYRNLVEGGQGYICTHDRKGNILSINLAAAASLGYEVGEIVGENMRKFMPPAFYKDFTMRLRKVWNESADSGLMYMLNKTGQERVWKYQNVKLTETVEEPIILGYAQDVTEMYQAEKQLKNLSLTDDLTGLYNRRGFLIFAERHLQTARAANKESGVFMLFADMDGLKQINDNYGHHEGSLAITKMGELLSGSCRGSDVIARLGGDEFAVLVIDERDETQEIIVNRINTKVAEYNARKSHPFDLAVSIGITPVNPQKQIPVEDILQIADEEMYKQKKRRKETQNSQA